MLNERINWTPFELSARAYQSQHKWLRKPVSLDRRAELRTAAVEFATAPAGCKNSSKAPGVHCAACIHVTVTWYGASTDGWCTVREGYQLTAELESGWFRAAETRVSQRLIPPKSLSNLGFMRSSSCGIRHEASLTQMKLCSPSKGNSIPLFLVMCLEDWRWIFVT